MTHSACHQALLDSRMTEAVHAHLAKCAPCSAFARALSRVDNWTPAEVPPPPDDLADRVVARVRAQAGAGWSSSPRRSWRIPRLPFGPLAASLSVAVVFGLVLLVGGAMHGRHQPGAGNGPASPRPFDPCASSVHCVVIAVDIGGDTAVSGTERQALGVPCSELAAISQTYREKPTAGVITLPIVHAAGGHRVFIAADIAPYYGPGAYSGVTTIHPTTVPFVTIDGTDYAAGTSPVPTLRATVAADGSGSLFFGALADTHDPLRTVSGFVTWSCR